MNVLSLFDGISGARVALDRLGIECTYYASEIDKHAIQIAQANYPDIIQLGAIQQVNPLLLPKIDLVVGGSPCQDLSGAGKGEGLKGERSGLFFDFVRLIRYLNPKYFLLENVASMNKLNKFIISQFMGVEPILIDSALVSAQQRKRLYWTNISNISQLEDKEIYFDIVFREENSEDLYYTDRAIENIQYWSKNIPKKIKFFTKITHSKFPMLEYSMYKNYSRQRLWVIEDIRGWRYVSPLECERLQTFPDGYTDRGISKTNRYKCLGNAFTVDVIAHILSFMQ